MKHKKQTNTKKLTLATLLAASLAVAPIAALTVVAPASATTVSTASTTLDPGGSYLKRADGSWTNGAATLSTKFAAVPASGGGLYTGVRVRESEGSYYLAHTRTYPDGTVQASIRRIVKTNGTSTETMLTARTVVGKKAAAGSAFSIKLQADGTDSVKLRATVPSAEPRSCSPRPTRARPPSTVPAPRPGGPISRGPRRGSPSLPQRSSRLRPP